MGLLHSADSKIDESIWEKGGFTLLTLPSVLKLTPFFTGLSLPPGLSLRVMPLLRVVELLLDSDFRQDFRPSAPLVWLELLSCILEVKEPVLVELYWLAG